jgi:hypothetical protein
MKICSNCKEAKEIANFTKNKNSRDGLKINCIDCCKILYNRYREKNYQKESERCKKYNKEKRVIDKEKLKIYKSEYYKANKEVIDSKNRKYREDNRIEIRNRRMNNVLLRLNENIGSSIRTSLKNRKYKKKSRTRDIIGCSIEYFKLYLESKFESWMTWENWGKYNGELNYGWDIDHIIPSSSAITESDVIRLNHYTNLQPLDSYINRYIKADKLDFKLNMYEKIENIEGYNIQY